MKLKDKENIYDAKIISNLMYKNSNDRLIMIFIMGRISNK